MGTKIAASSPSAPASETTPHELVHYEQRGGVALLTLNDPPTNAYTFEMMQQLDEAVMKARFDPGIHVIVITGAGERFFCGGADIKMLQRMGPTYKYNFCRHANETLDRMTFTSKVIIAAINGHCTGGGLEVAMACDLLLARKSAGKIGLPEVKLGVLPGTGGTVRLTQLIGRTRALKLMLTGELIDFDLAQDIGLITDVLTAESDSAFVDQVVKYAEENFCPPNAAPIAQGFIKRSVHASIMGGHVAASAVEGELMRHLFGTPDAGEGLTAFVERRKPEFTGKASR